MAELVVGRFRPSPGQDPYTYELPGPGTYEADFLVGSIVAEALPDAVADRQFTFRVGGKKITHIRTTRGEKVVRRLKYDQQTVTVRFEVEDEGPPPIPGYQEAGFGVIAVQLLRVLLPLALAGAIVKALIEIRKIAQTPAGALAVGGVGLLAAGVGVAMLLGKR